MSLTLVKGMQSEIFVPITPPSVWAPVTKELKDMTIALATAAGVHHKDQERFNLAGDFTWRKVTDDMPSSELMVSHGGYDNSDVNKDINCMFPIDRIHELAKEGFIKACAPVHAGDAVSVVIANATLYIPFEELVDISQEIERLKKEEKRLEGELARVNGMLGNERFLSKAPEDKVAAEKEKLEKYTLMMEQVKVRLAQLQQ